MNHLQMDKGGHNNLSRWEKFGGVMIRPSAPSPVNMMHIKRSLNLMDTKPRTQVEKLLTKASDAPDAAQAVSFSEAALNLARAFHLLKEIEKMGS